MSSNIISQLQELQKKSNKKLNPTIISTLQDHAKPRALVEATLVSSGKFAIKPVKGTSSLSTINNRFSRRKVSTLQVSSIHALNKLNKELLGGESYPVLTTALGIAGGVISGGASLLFTLATTGLSLANTTSKVLARPGDEIWHIEEIGKEGNKAIYLSAFFIVDPYRKQAPNKGWLIHEEREELTLS
jgi:hypothetical protein